MKTVLYSSPFVPAEWIAAHGMRPSRMLPLAAETGGHIGSAAVGVCPYARACVHEVASQKDADAVVFTTTCDQMRRSAELIARSCNVSVFLFHVPATWQTNAAHGLYADELRRLGRFLVRLGGSAPSRDELARVMREFETARSAVCEARGRLSARQFSQAIADFQRDGKVNLESLESAAVPRGVPVALVGSPLLRGHFDVFDVVEKAGGHIALDATTSGERPLPAPFDRREIGDDPFTVLVSGYFGNIPDAFRRPNSELYVWLKHKIAERDIRGIIFRHYTWCDLWHAEAQRMKESSDLPLFVMAIGDEEGLDGHTVSRIQSFVEILR